jgi:hypothetical protein
MLPPFECPSDLLLHIQQFFHSRAINMRSITPVGAVVLALRSVVISTMAISL